MTANDRDHGDLAVGAGHRTPYPWLLTCAAAVVFSILIALGFWQLQRLAWKEDLIRQLETRRAAEPVSIDIALARQRQGENIDYLRVRVAGTYLHDAERHLYAPDAKLGPGFDVFTPFVLGNEKGLLVVNRGFVPDRMKDPDQRKEGQVDGVQRVTGLIRLPTRKGPFTPDNDAAQNIWFWRDFAAMTAGLAGRAGNGNKVALFVDAEAPAPGGWPRGNQTRIALSNRHFGYAMTWFGLAATLLGVYIAMMWGRRRR